MTKKIILLVALIGMGVPFLLQILRDNLYISREIDKMIAEPLFFISLSLFVTSLFLLRVRDEVFRSWLHFAYWWLPLSIFLIVTSPNSGGGNMGLGHLIDQEGAAIGLSVLFFLISLAIIAVKSWRLRKGQ